MCEKMQQGKTERQMHSSRIRTKTCYLSVDDPLSVFDTNDEMIGVFSYEMTDVNYYEPEVTGIIHFFEQNQYM